MDPLGIAGAAAGAVAGAAVGMLMNSQRAKFKVFKPTMKDNHLAAGDPEPDQDISFSYNPKEYKFGHEVQINESGGAAGATQRQVIGPKPRTFDFDLIFDKFELMAMGQLGDGSNLQKIAKKFEYLTTLQALTNPTTDTPKALPVVQFAWGELLTEPALCHKADLKYTMFFPTGDPLRLVVGISISEIDTRPPAETVPGTNPTSGSDRIRRTHTMLLGESLASVAYREYGDAGYWRAIASENELDDPLRVQPGTLLMLPSRADAQAGR